jgi:hypothetical protein
MHLFDYSAFRSLTRFVTCCIGTYLTLARTGHPTASVAALSITTGPPPRRSIPYANLHHAQQLWPKEEWIYFGKGSATC